MFVLFLCATGQSTIKGASAQTASPAAASGAIISEFRFRGTAGTSDEYVEIVNTLDAPLNISGWTIQTKTGTAAAPNLQTSLVPPDTLVPPRGHFLFTGSGYSLGVYNTGDALIAGDMSDDSGVALFNVAGAVQDAVGFASSAPALREGAGLTSAPTVNGQHVWMRDFSGQFPKDSADSSQDFVFLSVDGAGVTGTGGAITARLGSPNPEGLAAPTLANTAFSVAILDPLTSQNLAPNRVRIGSGDSGSLLVRRTLKNNTDRTITKVRMMVTNITSQGSPFITTNQADVRLAGSATETVQVQGQPVTVFGTSVDAPSIPTTGTPLVGGGGLGSNLAFDLVLATPLQPGQSRAYTDKFNSITTAFPNF